MDKLQKVCLSQTVYHINVSIYLALTTKQQAQINFHGISNLEFKLPLVIVCEEKRL